MDANQIIQYSLVCAVFLAACIWMIVKTRKKNKSSGGCCGCDLKDSCKKFEARPHDHKNKGSQKNKRGD